MTMKFVNEKKEKNMPLFDHRKKTMFHNENMLISEKNEEVIEIRLFSKIKILPFDNIEIPFGNMWLEKIKEQQQAMILDEKKEEIYLDKWGRLIISKKLVEKMNWSKDDKFTWFIEDGDLIIGKKIPFKDAIKKIYEIMNED